MAISVKSPACSPPCRTRAASASTPSGCRHRGPWTPSRYQVGNYLVGNDEGAAGLEITYFGPELEFTEDAVIAVTGSEMPPKLNGEEAPTWEALRCRRGRRALLRLPQERRPFLSGVSGGVDVPVFMHSRSTYTLIGLGGHEGRALQEGDELQLGEAPDGDGQVGKKVEEDHVPRLLKGDGAARDHRPRQLPPDRRKHGGVLKHRVDALPPTRTASATVTRAASSSSSSASSPRARAATRPTSSISATR